MSTKNLTVGEVGRVIRVSSDGFDMVLNTELKLAFLKPSKSFVTKTKTGGEVTLGTVLVEDEDLGLLEANQYVEYITEVGFLDEYGDTWHVCLTYTNDVETPDHIFKGNRKVFTVDKPCSAF